MHVLIGTDGSDDAVAAAVNGLALLGGVEQVTLVCAADTRAAEMAGKESGFAGGMATEEEIRLAAEAANSEATEALERTAAALPAGMNVQSRTVEGDAGALLCRLAEDLPADTIVVGSRGHGAIRRALLGSVSTYVANNAPCPVVIVRSGVE